MRIPGRTGAPLPHPCSRGDELECGPLKHNNKQSSFRCPVSSTSIFVGWRVYVLHYAIRFFLIANPDGFLQVIRAHLSCLFTTWSALLPSVSPAQLTPGWIFSVALAPLIPPTRCSRNPTSAFDLAKKTTAREDANRAGKTRKIRWGAAHYTAH